MVYGNRWITMKLNLNNWITELLKSVVLQHIPQMNWKFPPPISKNITHFATQNKLRTGKHERPRKPKTITKTKHNTSSSGNSMTGWGLGRTNWSMGKTPTMGVVGVEQEVMRRGSDGLRPTYTSSYSRKSNSLRAAALCKCVVGDKCYCGFDISVVCDQYQLNFY